VAVHRTAAGTVAADVTKKLKIKDLRGPAIFIAGPFCFPLTFWYRIGYSFVV
jgi:hypothetical protein